MLGIGTKFTESLKPNKQSFDDVYAIFEERYKDKQDPWGLDLKKHRFFLELCWPLFKHYFKVKIHGTEKIKDRPYMVISNHSGQIAIDGVLIMMAFTFLIDHPRILRGMIERFLPATPFLGEIIAQTGNILGDRRNCLHLLEQKESILVFPEGVRGIAKSTPQYYKLQGFTSGFFRLAIQSQTEVLPIAVVGAEEFYPWVLQLPNVAKWLKLPAFPLSPTFPLLGAFGVLPMPSPVDIYVGDPYPIPEGLSADAPDKEINKHVYKIENSIQTMINNGLKKKRTFFGTTKYD